MRFRNHLSVFVLLTVAAVQPALAQEASAAKFQPAIQTIQLADVPMREMIEESSSAGAAETTRGENVGFNLDELLMADAAKACPGGGNAKFTWTIKDGCLDGLGIFIRFFDETNNLVFPNSSQAYLINSGRTNVFKLTVKRGGKICYGAEPSNRDGSYWGVGLDNDQGCANCCNIVPNSGNLSRSVNLICS